MHTHTTQSTPLTASSISASLHRSAVLACDSWMHSMILRLSPL